MKYDLVLDDAHGIGGGEVQLWFGCSLTGLEFCTTIKVKVFTNEYGVKVLKVVE